MSERKDSPEQSEFRAHAREWLAANRPAPPTFRMPVSPLEVMTEEQRRDMRNQTEQLQIDAMQEVVEQSKTKQRSPKMFRKFL